MLFVQEGKLCCHKNDSTPGDEIHLKKGDVMMFDREKAGGNIFISALLDGSRPLVKDRVGADIAACFKWICR